MTAIVRLRQGLRALFAFAQPFDETQAADILSPPLLGLFRQMRHSERLHSLRVLAAVQQQGPTPSDLAVAALLHDVGKSRYRLRIWQKTLPVLVRAAAPGLFRRLTSGNPDRWWNRPFAVYAHHPAWGAEMAAAGGASETTVWLIQHHQDSPAHWENDPQAHLLKRLQAADDAN